MPDNYRLGVPEVHTNLDPKSLLRDERTTVYFLPALIFIASGVLSHILISIFWRSLMNKFKQSTMARYLLISTAIVSWCMFVILLLQYIIVIRYMDIIIDIDPTLHAYRGFFRAQTTSSYIQWVLFISLVLISCFCRLCLCSRTFSKKTMYFAMILGYMSCVQMTSVFAFHCVLYFFVNPLYTVIRVTTTVVAFTLPILFIAMFQFAMDYYKNWRQCEHVCSDAVDCKKLSLLLLIYTIAFSILLYINNLFAKGVKGLVAESLLSSGVLMTTIIASIIVTMLGYLTKKIIFQKFPNRIDLQLQQNLV